ncbi:beta-galactosidase GalB [Desertivirga xinjiangensis]|uniref:beta-galactosidase GalB n=1 Tax=Desertivirga xinjiangensis TaxID=539206 RepID=UPI00210EFE5C|nr:beta-galactosidase GalB [Pedobacter xinjiangensis]
MISSKIIRQILPAMFLSLYFVAAAQRNVMVLDKNWKFNKGDDVIFSDIGFNDQGWSIVSVPHDWAITGPFDRDNDIQLAQVVQDGEKKPGVKTGRSGGLPWMGTAWYRQNFNPTHFMPGKKAILLFDGAMSNATVFINGQKVGNWPYGYSSFWFDVTSFLKPGSTNVLAVRLENKPESSRWYPGAGLFRNVHLIIKNSKSIKTWGSFITTPEVSENSATVKIKTELENGAGKGLRLETTFVSPEGKVVADVSAPATEGESTVQTVKVTTPKLWSVESPFLYTAITKVFAGKFLVDESRTRFGIRTIKVEPLKGFLLNGKVTRFKGVCNHHDLGPLGAAVNTAALKRQLVILKDMGCNAIRTSHNPPAPELLDLCDEMGFMVIDESFDEWKIPKMPNGYSQNFDQWAEKDMVNMLHRDRNHPSIVMWSIGNEINEQSSKDGGKVAKFLQDICHREDPTRPVTAGMDRFDAAVNNGFAAILDVPGFNYKPSRYQEAMKKLPQGFVLGSETASTVSSRGIYKFPVQEAKQKKYADSHSSSYDVEACSWSQTPDEEFMMQDSLPYMMGEFVWTGFDYLGEPTPYNEQWPSRSSYFGIIDLAGIPKDRYYLYRSRWNSLQETLHMVPHWTWPGREGLVTPVFVYTNYPAAELFINGKSQGIRRKNNSDKFSRYRLMWNDAIYEPGELKIVAYDEQGRRVAQRAVKTSGKPHHLELVADRTVLESDGKDLAYVTVKIVDAEGNLCPTADNSIFFEVTGQGQFRAVCNGDPTSLEMFHLPQMKAFNGMLVGTIQSSERAGEIQVHVQGEGLQKGVLRLKIK